MGFMTLPRGNKPSLLGLFLSFLLFLLLVPLTVSATEQVFYYHNDHLGSPVAITNANGNVVWRAEYEPFGKTASLTETNPINTHRFIGKERDQETGLDYFGSRFYDAGIGRFLSLDPVGVSISVNSQRLNLYAYVLNNPFRYIDKTGKYEEDFHRYLTAFVAYGIGFTREQAMAFGAADQWVDDNPDTNPIGFSNLFNAQMRADYHFPSPERLNVLLSVALSGDTGNAGQYLHALQDSYSHAGYDPFLGHAFAGHGPDYPYTDPSAAFDAAFATYDFLSTLYGLPPEHSFDELLPTLGEYFIYESTDWEDRTSLLPSYEWSPDFIGPPRPDSF